MRSNASEEKAAQILEAASRWVVRHSDRESALPSCPEFEAWYRGDTRHAQAYDRLAILWRSIGEVDKTTLRKRPPRNKGRTAIAAAMLAAIAGYYGTSAMSPAADYISGTQVQRVTLPDGSIVVLDADTAIALDFQSGRRQVRLLKGRALFEPVARQSDMRDFSVATPQAIASALGTRYTVSLQGPSTRVEVIEHDVAVQCLPCIQGDVTTLSAGSTVTVSNDGFSKVSASDTQVQDWVDGLMSFDDIPLPRVAEQLSRYTGKLVVVLGETARSQRISGVAKVADPQRALALLLAQSRVRVYDLPGLLLLR